MRIGENPEKKAGRTNPQYQHRVVVACYIPDAGTAYFEHSIPVLQAHLDALFQSIDPACTAVTFINNGAGLQVKQCASVYPIDKYVEYPTNKGKVYAQLQEAQAAFEPFVTLVDADVWLHPGWEQAVFDIFKKVPRAGAVSPLPVPHCALGQNDFLMAQSWLGRIGYGEPLSDTDAQNFIDSINNPNIFQRKNAPSWDKAPLYLRHGQHKVMIGATHLVATYRRVVLCQKHAFPEAVFAPGDEFTRIDHWPQTLGMYRLCTSRAFAYHMGNILEPAHTTEAPTKLKVLTKIDYGSIAAASYIPAFWIPLGRWLGKLAIRWIWKK